VLLPTIPTQTTTTVSTVTPTKNLMAIVAGPGSIKNKIIITIDKTVFIFLRF